MSKDEIGRLLSTSERLRNESIMLLEESSRIAKEIKDAVERAKPIRTSYMKEVNY